MSLTPYETRIVNILKETPEQTVRRSNILDALYFDIPEQYRNHKSNSLEVLVGRLRRKGHKIKSVRGIGYALMSNKEEVK
jgi:DNA-binding response OmpR family regulator